MPELPEVEAVRRELSIWLTERTIGKITTSGLHRGVEKDGLESISNCPVDAVDRIGKYLTLHVGGQILAIHLGMSGRLLSYYEQTYTPGPHDHVKMSIDDGRLIVFQDHRRFGRVFLSPSDLSGLPRLGPDPTQERLTSERLAEILSSRHGKLKPVLLDQSVICGLGNIYSCEILWAAQLSPIRVASSLTIQDCKTLVNSIEDVLTRAIALGGSTLDDYRGTTGEMGNFDLHFSVFAKAEEGCPRCGSPIAAERIAGRITYWCRACQQ
jgi:formamidopyrimidine-DNA glycosylase